jgi:hypothetical protein
LISRKAIWGVEQALKTHPAENILVLVSWSGPDRHDVFIDETSPYFRTGEFDIPWTENPHNFTSPEDKAHRGWLILNACFCDWNMPAANDYYSRWHSETGQMVLTLEHIVRTQMYFKSKGIAYGMWFYTDVYNTDYDWSSKEFFMYDLIDWNGFISRKGYYDYVMAKGGPDYFFDDGFHPNRAGAEMWMKDQILPYLVSRGWGGEFTG